MLAQSFLTAAQLKLTEHEHAALIDVLGRLERGEMQHVMDYGDQGYYRDGKISALEIEYPFCMDVFECGTVRCMAGWCDALHGTRFAARCRESGHYAERSPSDDQLLNLFVTIDAELEDITVEQAACALRNYLTTGAPRWQEVLA